MYTDSGAKVYTAFAILGIIALIVVLNTGHLNIDPIKVEGDVMVAKMANSCLYLVLTSMLVLFVTNPLLK
jgi:hypothetical protein